MPRRHHPRGAVQHGAEVVAAAQFGLAGGDTHPHRQLQRSLSGDRGIDRRTRRGEHRAHPVAGVVEQPAIVRFDGSRKKSSWASSAARIASASASHRRVEPSISVNRKVRTPEGRR